MIPIAPEPGNAGVGKNNPRTFPLSLRPLGRRRVPFFHPHFLKTSGFSGAALLLLAAAPAWAQRVAPADTTTAPLRQILTPEVAVTATRASANTGTAYQTVGRAELQARNFGQDLPYLLDQTPSVVTTSDAGTGIGYTGLRIRGTDASRINVTLNGVPVNEAESHGVFFVDLPDLASSVQSIQVQRGVGPSTNGASSFGGSLNVETLGLRAKPYAEFNNSAGSFGTWKTSIAAGTGLLGGHFAVDARASRLQSEGYVDRGWSRLRSLYLTGTYSAARTLVRALVMSGQEQTYQAWYGVPQDSVRRGNRRFNPAGYDFDDFVGTQRASPYGNQTDNYQQDYYQLLISHQLGSGLTASITPFWTRGGGYYEEFKASQKFAKYGIGGPVYQPNAAGSLDTLRSTDVVRRRWLKTDLFGATYALQKTFSNSLIQSLTLGGALVGYRGQHFDELQWAQRGREIPAPGTRYYEEPDARKTDFNTYLRGTFALAEGLSLFADAQYRRVAYTVFAPVNPTEKAQQTFTFGFFNPKAGLTYQLPAGLQAFASYAQAQREPTRSDYTDAPAARRPTSERLHDFEAGLRRQQGQLQFGLTGYYMRYDNQLVLNGQLDDVGNALHVNVPDSYRAGLELEAALRPVEKLTLRGAITLSRNRILAYTDYLYDYDQSKETGTAYAETTIAYSPAVVANFNPEVQPLPGLFLALPGRYVSRQYLDNTATDGRSLAGYFVQDARLRYLWPVGSKAAGTPREVEFAVQVSNILSRRYENNGYTYGYISGGETYRFSYLSPQAPANVLASLNVRF